jgi:SAM-dependent methyltransferase
MLRAQLLHLIDVARGRGLEIGPLDKPIVTRDLGPVEYIDRAPRAELQAWYGGHGDVDAERIVDVDHVWGDRSLLECVGGVRAFDYVVASHVIEHVPDVFGWLGEIADVLTDGGRAALFVPDKRQTFDLRRPVSASGEFVDAYLRRSRRPDARQVFNHFYEFREVSAPEPDDAAVTERARDALALCRRMAANGEYIDAHCWVFTPASLVRALDLASRLDLLPFEIHTIETALDEFLVILRRLPEGGTAEARRAAFVASVARPPVMDEAVDGGASIADLQAGANAALARAHAIETSTIWRLTRPLRAAVDSARRLMRR